MGYYKRYHPEIERKVEDLNNYRKMHGKMTRRHKHINNYWRNHFRKIVADPIFEFNWDSIREVVFGRE